MSQLTTCKRCYYSEQYFGEGRFGLYCSRFNRDCETVSECDAFQYEPGTDAEESAEYQGCNRD